MLPAISADMTLKEIMELHPKLEDKLRSYGFDVCCAKMEALETACKKKGVTLSKVLRELNGIVEEINLVESIVTEVESSWKEG
ncbi:MAG: hypothetical protein PWP37_1741 [Thermotogota bacterium]|nr:hypothetical protein [Thermotogota bacterium]